MAKQRSLTTRQADLAFGLVAFLVGVLIVLGSFGLAYTGRGVEPGPGFLPRWVGLGLALTGVGIALSRLFTRSAGASPAVPGSAGILPAEAPLVLPDARGFKRVGLALLLLVALAIAFEPLGFLVTLTLLCFLLLVVLEGESLPRAAAFAVALVLLFYLIFAIWLGLRLPLGLLRF